MTRRFHQSAHMMREFLVRLPRSAKTLIVISTDLLGFAFCVIAALWLIALGHVVGSHPTVVFATAFVSVGLGWWMGMYRSVVRYLGLDLLISASLSAIGSALAGAMLTVGPVAMGTDLLRSVDLDRKDTGRDA